MSITDSSSYTNQLPNETMENNTTGKEEKQEEDKVLGIKGPVLACKKVAVN